MNDTANNTSECSTTLSRSSFLLASTNPILNTKSLKAKKSVTIILPHTGTREKPFGVHLQIRHAVTLQITEKPSYVRGDVSDQVRNIKRQTMFNLVELFPSITTSINHLFSNNPKKLLMSISTTMIGDLVFNLRA